MILSTHALAGAALASLTPNPAIGFAVGFASHFLLDAFPHWDYTLRSSRENEEHPLESDIVLGRDFARDLVKIGADCLAGFAAVTLLFMAKDGGDALRIALAGAFGGVLPDALQLAYYKFRHQPLIFLQRFHMRIHAHQKIRDWRVGLPMQIIAASGLLVYAIFAR